MSAPPFVEMKVDSGASANFHEVSHHLPHQPLSTSNPSVSVIVPNGQIMTSQSTTNLPLPNLPPSATHSHGFPSLASGSLLSVGRICDHHCTAIFTDRSVKMFRNMPMSKLNPLSLPSSPAPATLHISPYTMFAFLFLHEFITPSTC